MKSTKLIEAMIDDTIEIMFNHAYSKDWVRERIMTIVSMAEDIKNIVVSEDIEIAFNESHKKCNSDRKESFVLESVNRKIFSIK